MKKNKKPPPKSREFRELLAKARELSRQFGCSWVSEIHILLVSVTDDSYCFSRILKRELKEKEYEFLVQRLEELARVGEKPVKKCRPNPFWWYHALRISVDEEKYTYKVGKVYPEHFFLAYLRSVDRYFLRCFLDFIGGAALTQLLRREMEVELFERS